MAIFVDCVTSFEGSVVQVCLGDRLDRLVRVAGAVDGRWVYGAARPLRNRIYQ